MGEKKRKREKDLLNSTSSPEGQVGRGPVF